MLKSLILVGLGGGVGSMLRYVIYITSTKYFETKLLLPTLIVNIAGSFLVAITIGYLAKHNAFDSSLKYLIAIGFCGGFTTFSAFAYENVALINNNQYGLAFLYIGLGIITCLFAVGLGLYMVK